jgi:hypothetical protein
MSPLDSFTTLHIPTSVKVCSLFNLSKPFGNKNYMLIFNGIGEAKILRNSNGMKTLNPFQYNCFYHLETDHLLVYQR